MSKKRQVLNNALLCNMVKVRGTCSLLRLLAEEWPTDLLPVGAAHSGAGGVWFSVRVQAGLAK